MDGWQNWNNVFDFTRGKWVVDGKYVSISDIHSQWHHAEPRVEKNCLSLNIESSLNPDLWGHGNYLLLSTYFDLITWNFSPYNMRIHQQYVTVYIFQTTIKSVIGPFAGCSKKGENPIATAEWPKNIFFPERQMSSLILHSVILMC